MIQSDTQRVVRLNGSLMVLLDPVLPFSSKLGESRSRTRLRLRFNNSYSCSSRDDTGHPRVESTRPSVSSLNVLQSTVTPKVYISNTLG